MHSKKLFNHKDSSDYQQIVNYPMLAAFDFVDVDNFDLQPPASFLELGNIHVDDLLSNYQNFGLLEKLPHM